VTAADLPAFIETYRGLAKVFTLPRTEGDPAERESAYFKALRPYDFAVIKAGADKLIATRVAGKFPIPAEWIAAMPARSARGDLRQMSDTEAREYRRAEAMRYEDAPCTCEPCRSAGVTDRMLRFVPDVDEDGQDEKAFDPIGKRVVTAGHWAHGEELARYWTAREQFFALFKQAVERHRFGRARRRRSLRERVDAIYEQAKVIPIDREPGEEG
jgi:hypothetical protein